VLGELGIHWQADHKKLVMQNSGTVKIRQVFIYIKHYILRPERSTVGLIMNLIHQFKVVRLTNYESNELCAVRHYLDLMRFSIWNPLFL